MHDTDVANKFKNYLEMLLPPVLSTPTSNPMFGDLPEFVCIYTTKTNKKH